MKFLPILLVFLLFACGQEELQYGHSFTNVLNRRKENLTWQKHNTKVNRKYYDRQELEDSLYVVHTIDSIVNHVKKTQGNFFKIESDTLSILYGYLFSNSVPHLFINKQKGIFNYINIFSNDNRTLNPVLYEKQYGLIYIGDSIADINGDGFKDYIIDWQAMSGTWWRNSYDIYIYNPATKGFEEAVDFTNCSFFASEKNLIGVDYGKPGTVGMYKYVWKGLKPVLVEVIYQRKNHPWEFVKMKDFTDPDYIKDGEGIILKKMPAEYKKARESYSWFTGNLN